MNRDCAPRCQKGKPNRNRLQKNAIPHYRQCCLNVLRIYRSGGDYVGIPGNETEIYPEDRQVIYGRSKVLQELEQRRADRNADQAHSASVREQKRYRAERERSESAHGRK